MDGIKGAFNNFNEENISINLSNDYFVIDSNLIEFSIKLAEKTFEINNEEHEIIIIKNNMSPVLLDSSKGSIKINSKYIVSTQTLNKKMLNLLLSKLNESDQLTFNNNTLNGQFFTDSNLLNILLKNFADQDNKITFFDNTLEASLENSGNNSALSDSVISYTNLVTSSTVPGIDYSILTTDLVDIVDLPSDINDNNGNGGNKCEEICCLLKSLDRNNNF